MLNSVILIGRLTADPELRYTQNGTPVGSFTVAVDRAFSNQQGERETDFISIVVWQKLAENCANHLGKGRLVCVDGRLQIRSYDDNQGIRRKAAEVVANNVKFLDWPKDGQQQQSQQNGYNNNRAGNGNNGYQQNGNGQRPPQNGGSQQNNGNNWADNSGAGFASEISFNEDEIPF